jgi:hypothetical protein
LEWVNAAEVSVIAMVTSKKGMGWMVGQYQRRLDAPVIGPLITQQEA